jgi:hypothetical protein
MKIADRSFENVTNQNLIHEESKGGLSSVWEERRLSTATIQSKAFSLQVYFQKCENEIMQDYNFACESVWVRNLVSVIKGGT